MWPAPASASPTPSTLTGDLSSSAARAAQNLDCRHAVTLFPCWMGRQSIPARCLSMACDRNPCLLPAACGCNPREVGGFPPGVWWLQPAFMRSQGACGAVSAARPAAAVPAGGRAAGRPGALHRGGSAVRAGGPRLAGAAAEPHGPPVERVGRPRRPPRPAPGRPHGRLSCPGGPRFDLVASAVLLFPPMQPPSMHLLLTSALPALISPSFEHGWELQRRECAHMCSCMHTLSCTQNSEASQEGPCMPRGSLCMVPAL